MIKNRISSNLIFLDILPFLTLFWHSGSLCIAFRHTKSIWKVKSIRVRLHLMYQPAKKPFLVDHTDVNSVM